MRPHNRMYLTGSSGLRLLPLAGERSVNTSTRLKPDRAGADNFPRQIGL